MQRFIYVENKTEYADPLYTRRYNRVLNPALYCIQKCKHKSYFIRSYYEYLDVIDKGGKAYFVTATFAPDSLPNYEGVNCFDYDLFRKFINGGFRKYLQRKFGYSLRYFCVNELGTHTHRPHHHMIIYLLGEHGQKVNLDGKTFLSIFQKYWKHGYCFKGKYGCEVLNFRAFNYLCKYICKSLESEMCSSQVYNNSFNRYYDKLIHDPNTFENWLRECNGSDTPACYRVHYPDIINSKLNEPLVDFFVNFDKNPRFKAYATIQAHNFADMALREFELHHSIRPRCSQGLGSCLADPSSKYYINPFKPLVKVPDKDGYRMEQVPLYIYRKLYTDVFEDYNNDFEKVRHYKLNNDGLRQKFIEFNSSIHKDINDTHSLLTTLGFDLPKRLVRKYIVYNTIYRGRYFDVTDKPDIRPKQDYYEGLCSGFDCFRTRPLCQQNLEYYSEFLCHPYFSDLSEVLTDIDTLLNDSYCSQDKENNEKFERLKRVSDNYKRLTNSY